MDNALQQAIAARAQTGVPAPQLTQTQQGAPAPMPPLPPSSVEPSNPGNLSQPMPKTPSEEEIITKALIQRQKMLGDMQRQGSQPTLQQMPIS